MPRISWPLFATLCQCGMGYRKATTIAANLVAEPTSTTVTTSTQRNIEVVGAAGSLETIGAPSKTEAEGLFQELLKEEGLLPANDTCAPCSAAKSRCCYSWQQGLARVQEPDFSNQEEGLQIRFRLDYEKPFDKELIQALHDLPFSSAEERREFGKKIAEQGIFKASQLQSVRKSNLPPGASPMLAAKFAEAKSSYKSEKLHEPEGAKRARENRKELKEDLEDKLEKGQNAITKAMEAMKTAAQSGSERLKKAAAEKMKQAKEYLEQIQVKDADLDTAEESSKLDGMMKFSDTDTIGGKHIPLNLLIEELGVMRGVSFARAAGPDQSFEAYDLVAQLKPAYTGYKEEDEDQLVAAIAVSPDLTSQQVPSRRIQLPTSKLPTRSSPMLDPAPSLQAAATSDSKLGSEPKASLRTSLEPVAATKIGKLNRPGRRRRLRPRRCES